MLVHKLCREEEVGIVDLWGSFVVKLDQCETNMPWIEYYGVTFNKDGRHLTTIK